MDLYNQTEPRVYSAVNFSILIIVELFVNVTAQMRGWIDCVFFNIKLNFQMKLHVAGRSLDRACNGDTGDKLILSVPRNCNRRATETDFGICCSVLINKQQIYYRPPKWCGNAVFLGV